MKAKSISGKGIRGIETVLAESMADGYKPGITFIDACSSPTKRMNKTK